MKTLPTFTVRCINRILGTSYFCGTFQGEQGSGEFLAANYAKKQAAKMRKFAEYEVWTGTPREPGYPTGTKFIGSV